MVAHDTPHTHCGWRLVCSTSECGQCLLLGEIGKVQFPHVAVDGVHATVRRASWLLAPGPLSFGSIQRKVTNRLCGGPQRHAIARWAACHAVSECARLNAGAYFPVFTQLQPLERRGFLDLRPRRDLHLLYGSKAGGRSIFHCFRSSLSLAKNTQSQPSDKGP